MARTVGIGIQDYAEVITNNYFYIDKTNFIKEWWESGDSVTLITRPRRFGKTLNLNMLDYFFSNKYAGRSDLFEGLSIWKEEKYRQLQGTYPVISLSFARIKESTYTATKDKICEILTNLYIEYSYVRDSEALIDADRIYFDRILSGQEPERFYHGFVLGLIAELHGKYTVTSNRESGFGRYDVMIEPKDKTKDALILEFKVHDPEDESDLKATVAAALQQIEEKQYEKALVAKGFSAERIQKYGFAFEGKKVLIG